MAKTIISGFYFVALSILLLSCNNDGKPIEEPAGNENPSLWSVKQAKQYLDTASNYVLFEVSKKEKYLGGHLPKSFNVWRPDYENKEDYLYEGMAAEVWQMEALLSKYGAEPDSEILIYDTWGSVDAARLWWILKEYGHRKVYIVDGGKTAWRESGLMLEALPNTLPTPSKYRFESNQLLKRSASFEMVKAAINDSSIVILDTREPEEYYGQPYLHDNKVYRYKNGAYTNGNIPGAIHLNWSDAVDLKGNHCIKSVSSLKYNFERLGVTPDKTIIVYCQSGVRSAHTTFVLTEILGYQHVFNYDGSWIEWSYKFIQGEFDEIERKTSKEEADRMYAILARQ